MRCSAATPSFNYAGTSLHSTNAGWLLRGAAGANQPEKYSFNRRDRCATWSESPTSPSRPVFARPAARLAVAASIPVRYESEPTGIAAPVELRADSALLQSLRWTEHLQRFENRRCSVPRRD